MAKEMNKSEYVTASVRSSVEQWVKEEGFAELSRADHERYLLRAEMEQRVKDVVLEFEALSDERFDCLVITRCEDVPNEMAVNADNLASIKDSWWNMPVH